MGVNGSTISSFFSRNIMLSIFLMLVASNLIVAQATGLGALSEALCTLYTGLTGLLPVVALLLIVLAGVIYAAGQMVGAETRARANVWATAMLTGAIIGLVIVIVAPTILNSLYPGVSTACG